MSEAVVDVLRGSAVESRHTVHVAVMRAGQFSCHGRAGNPHSSVFARSAVKALQAMPLVEDGAAAHFGFGARELALACASHSGEARHVELAGSMLERIGAEEADLACGAHAPMSRDAARALRAAGGTPTRLHNNCSGKHAGMLALAAFHGWARDGYHREEHPVQQRMRLEMARWCDVASSDIVTAIDGCGVTTFALPLAAWARAFASLAAEARAGAPGPAALVSAMTGHPELVAGTGRLCTELMRITEGRVFLKVGAEGVYCAASRDADVGIALKVEDGAMRALEPAIIAVLAELDLLTRADMERLDSFAEPRLLNTRGEEVGRLRARVRLERRA